MENDNYQQTGASILPLERIFNAGSELFNAVSILSLDKIFNAVIIFISCSLGIVPDCIFNSPPGYSTQAVLIYYVFD